MRHARMTGHETEGTGKVVKSLRDGVILARQRQGLGALSPPPPSLCPSLTLRLSDNAVILNRPFICLPNGNPPLCFLFTFSFFWLLCLISHSPSSPVTHIELLAVPLIQLRNPNLNNNFSCFVFLTTSAWWKRSRIGLLFLPSFSP